MTREALKKSIKARNKENITELKRVKFTGGTTEKKLSRLVDFFMRSDSKKISGRLIHVNEVDKLAEKFSNLKSDSGLLRRVNYEL